MRISIFNFIEISGFIFSIIVSNKLLDNPFFGGSLFIGFQLILLFTDFFSAGTAVFLPQKERKLSKICLIVSILVLLFNLILFPFIVDIKSVLQLILFVLLQFPMHYFIRKKTSATYLIFSALPGILLFFSLEKELKLFVFLYCIFAFVLSFFYKIFAEKKADPDHIKNDFTVNDIQNLIGLNSYKYYWKMTANTKAAFEVSILLALCYMAYLPFKGFWQLLTDAAVLLGLYLLAASISKFILSKIVLRELGKNTVFAVFSVVWIATNYNMYENYGKLSGIYLYITFVILCICITALASIIIAMDSDMQIIGYLGIEHFSVRKFELLKRIINHLSMFISRSVILLVISFLAFFTELSSFKSQGTVYVLGRYGFTLLPALFLIFAVIAAIRQPLTRIYEEKLKKYVALKKEGKVNKSLEKRLRHVLVEKYSKKLGIRILMFLVKPFFYHKVIGRNNVDVNKFPSVFVCNHSKVYGPIAAILNIPFYVKPWILREMVDNNRIAAHIQKGTFDRQKWIPKLIRDKLGKLFGPMVAWAMQSTEPIPVFRNDGRELIKGINMSVDALEAHDNILLFPENPYKTNGYVTEGVGEFYSGFVNIARDYYKRTGKRLTFYSVFADKKKRTLAFSEGITFDPENSFKKEKERITRYLHSAMISLYLEQ